MIVVGSRVNRIENRAVTGATVLEIVFSNEQIDEKSIKIAYDEGGEGWWPESCLTLIE